MGEGGGGAIDHRDRLVPRERSSREARREGQRPRSGGPHYRRHLSQGQPPRGDEEIDLGPPARERRPAPEGHGRSFPKVLDDPGSERLDPSMLFREPHRSFN